jgi:nucleoside-diphosphate-sugar epimerase
MPRRRVNLRTDFHFRMSKKKERSTKIFVTGATGFIGSAVAQELIGAGYKVIGLARSDAGGKSLIAAGAQVHRSDLKDPEVFARRIRNSQAGGKNSRLCRCAICTYGKA